MSTICLSSEAGFPIRMGQFVGRTKGHEKRNAVRRPGHPSKGRWCHGESPLRVNAKSRPAPLTELAQVSVNECRHLPGMSDAYIENDGITCPYAQALLRHALYQAFEMRSWTNLQCRWRVFVLILHVERDLVDFEAPISGTV